MSLSIRGLEKAKHQPGKSVPAKITAWLLMLALFMVSSSPAPAYSVLTHEQIVDFLWDSDIKKVLNERFPGATIEQFRTAHAYAYGGSLIQDMGYYPGGSKFFSDLVHYVRSGEFVSEMIRQARDMNELAFALGALAHYVSDTDGHPVVNRAVPVEFPKLKKKFGDLVTYEDNPIAHIQTEFGFDLVQVAQQRYTSQAFHDFIGFQVARPVLDRAFEITYGMKLNDVLSDEDRAISSYRHAISIWLPRITQAALIAKKKELEAVPNFNPKTFRYILRRSQYEREYGKNYYKPSFASRMIAGIVRILPKVGPLRAIDPKPPTAETEKMYIKGLEVAVTDYRKLVRDAADQKVTLPDNDLDTGKPTAPGEYKLADGTYERLLRELALRDFSTASPDLRANILSYYGDLSEPIATKHSKCDWKEVLRDLDALKKHPVNTPQSGE
jgi:Zinc dependent phospholipase C